jgi:serine protease AprX
MKNIAIVMCGLFLLAITSHAQSQEWKSKINPIVWQKSQKAKAECIIVLQEQIDVSAAELLDTKLEKGTFVFNTLKQAADKSQRKVKAVLIENKSAFRTFYIVNAIWAEANATTLEQLARLPEVAHILENPHSHLDEPVATKAITERGPLAVEWGIHQILADSVWALGYKGQGVVIGGEDTGYDWTHPALKKSYRASLTDSTANHSYAWHDAIHKASPLSSDTLNPCGYNTKAPCDDQQHGTHTMGTMAGSTSTMMIGVAPAARWIGCRNMERGNGSNASYIECFDWFLAPTDINNKNPNPSKAPHVVNNSWYCSVDEGCKDSLSFALMGTAVKNLRTAGIVVVVSNGNAGPDCSTVGSPPQFFSESYTVGATNFQDSIAGFSSRGPVQPGYPNAGKIRPAVSAPGVDIVSALKGGGYTSFSGTSMAGPHVAGAVALLISANPKLAGNPNRIEQILRETATPLKASQSCGGVNGNLIPNNTFGYGRINVLAAVRKALMTSETKDLKNIQTLTVFPNPTQSEIRFNSNEKGEVQVLVFDVKGRMVQNAMLQNIETDVLNMDALQNGTYICKIMLKSGIAYAKIIKQ